MEGIDPGTSDPHFEAERDTRAAIHAYACGPKGVHAMPVDTAVAHYAALRAGQPEPDAPSILWFDLVNPGPTEAEFLRTRLKLHPLAVEDCTRGRQRPKLERYTGYFFLVAYAARVNQDRDRVAFNELHSFFGERFIITVRDHRIDEVKETLVRWRAAPEHFSDVGTIAHGLLDAIVDSYFAVIDHIAEHVSRAENELLNATAKDSLKHVLMIRRELILFRRVVAPIRDIIARLVRRDLPFVSPSLVPYFQDVRDHAIRITEEIDTLRELVASVLESHDSAASQQLNQTLRMMAAWSIILMSIAAIAGIYGMNFRFMPETDWRYGYGFALGLMLVVGLGLVFLFRRRRWI